MNTGAKTVAQGEKMNGDNRPAMPIYLDFQATTPTDPRVVQAMLPWFTEKFGNPHSRNHAYGWEAEEAVEKARAQVASIIGADERETAKDGGRALLNLGHTFGHAIENAAGYGEYLHGEAVAIGLSAAVMLSRELSFASAQDEGSAAAATGA